MNNIRQISTNSMVGKFKQYVEKEDLVCYKLVNCTSATAHESPV